MNNCERDFENRTTLITGASGTIGAAIATKFANSGSDIALQYFTNKPLELIESIQKTGVNICAFQADLHEENFAKSLISKTRNELCEPDILINCAADQSMEMFGTMSNKTFQSTMQSNLNAVFALSKEFAKYILAGNKNHAAIVNISSIEASRPALGHGHYATSKAALEMLTKSMAQEFGPVSGLRVNAIAPGLIERPEIKKQWPQGVTSWEKACPLSRMGTANDIADAAIFLASPKAGFITGVTLTVDGGMSVMPAW